MQNTTATQTPTASITRELLALPEINHSGIERSVVFHALPAQAQSLILQAATEEEKLALAIEAGDPCEAVGQIYRDVIAAPAARRAAGVFLPTFDSLDRSFLKGAMCEEERAARRNGPK